MRNHHALWDALAEYLSDRDNICPNSCMAQILDNTTLDMKTLVKDALVFIFAGTDTTSKAVSSVFLYLSRNPEV